MNNRIRNTCIVAVIILASSIAVAWWKELDREQKKEMFRRACADRGGYVLYTCPAVCVKGVVDL